MGMKAWSWGRSWSAVDNDDEANSRTTARQLAELRVSHPTILDDLKQLAK